MKIIAEVTIIPIGVGVSLSPYVAACEAVFRQFPLEIELHANGTNLEGDYDDVVAAIKACHVKLHDMGAPRIATNIKLGSRTDRAQNMGDRVTSVLEKLDS